MITWLPMSPATQTLFTLIFLFGSDADFSHFGKIAAMAVVEPDAHCRAFRQSAFAPAGLFRDELDDADHAFGIHHTLRTCRRSVTQ